MDTYEYIPARKYPTGVYIARRVDPVYAYFLKTQTELQGYVDLKQLLHVTVMYSPKPITTALSRDKAGLWVQLGHIDVLGNALVVNVCSAALKNRHRDLYLYGLQHSFPLYRPHITLDENIDPNIDISPIRNVFDGKIVLLAGEYIEDLQP